jgi:hypothetical protein
MQQHGTQQQHQHQHPRRSRRNQRNELVRRQQWLAAHICEVEVNRSRSSVPRRSLRLSAQRAPGYRYVLVGKEGYCDPTDILRKLPAYGFRRVGEGGNVRVLQGTPPLGTIGGGIERSTPAEGCCFARFLARQQEVDIANVERQAAADNTGGNKHHQVQGTTNVQANGTQANAVPANAARANNNTSQGCKLGCSNSWGLRDNFSKVSEPKY